MSTPRAIALALLALGLAGATQAATWTSGSGSGSNCSSGIEPNVAAPATPLGTNEDWGNTCTIAPVTNLGNAAAGSTATVTAFASAGYSNSATTGGSWQTAALTRWSGGGFGEVSRAEVAANQVTAPFHAIDNSMANEGVLVNFGSSTTLSQLTTGWASSGSTSGSGSADVTVLAYTGSVAGLSASSLNLGSVGVSRTAGGTFSQNMTGAGWTVVGNYSGFSTSNAINISSTVSSTYWFVMAYNSAFGNISACAAGVSSCGVGSAGTNGNDYFKLLTISGQNSNGTPEPGALALAGLGLLGVAYSRRRKA